MLKKSLIAAVFCSGFIVFSALGSVPAHAESLLLKKGTRSEEVTALQKDLKELGFFHANTTGYFGDITKSSVIELQRKYGIKVDGIAGPQTFSLITRLKGDYTELPSRGGDPREEVDYAMPWFEGVNTFFDRGTEATVYDIDSGLSFRIKRTYGTNHADCETLTLQDTNIMRTIYGGNWSWQRRAVIVTVNGRKIAASMAGMPHAGVESKPANITVTGRSEGYGTGINLDAVKGNQMSGHFDIHFLGSRTHGTNRVDPDHKSMVRKAEAWAENNY